MIARLLEAAPFRGVRPVETLRFDMRDVYPPTHWAIRGEPPAFDTPDEDVYLEGRNIVLLSKAAVFMARARLTRLYIGPLAGNPFPDATPEFFATLARALSLGLATPIEIEAPFAALHKADVIGLGRSARRAAGAHAVVHAASRRAALRPLQQVSRAKRCVSRGRRGGPDEVREGAGSLTGAQAGLSRIVPSPVRTRICLPPAPRRPRSVRRLSSLSVSGSPITSRSLRMEPSPVWASSSAPNPVGK